MPNEDSAYEVGYKKPPETTRFKSGQSGNPKGRPKGSLNIASVLMRTLREQVTINQNGRRRKVTKLEAACIQVTNKAINGDLRALHLLVGLVRSAEESLPHAAEGSPDKDNEVMANILMRMQRSLAHEQGNDATE